jgi:F-type H+-transporting ATPase subunit b
MHIDWWTLALQTVNVLVLVWILGRFLFRPTMAIVAKRQQEANDLIADAARARVEAAALRAEADRAGAALAVQRDKLTAEANAAARVERQVLLDRAAQEVAKLHADAETAIDQERKTAQASIAAHAGDLAVDIARRLLTRVPEPHVLPAFTDDICRAIAALPEAERERLAARSGQPIEITTAEKLAVPQQQALREVLSQAVGGELSVVFHNDPAVIAGIELKSAATIIRGSWRADLDRVRTELDAEDDAKQNDANRS